MKKLLSYIFALGLLQCSCIPSNKIEDRQAVINVMQNDYYNRYKIIVDSSETTVAITALREPYRLSECSCFELFQSYFSNHGFSDFRALDFLRELDAAFPPLIINDSAAWQLLKLIDKNRECRFSKKSKKEFPVVTIFGYNGANGDKLYMIKQLPYGLYVYKYHLKNNKGYFKMIIVNSRDSIVACDNGKIR